MSSTDGHAVVRLPATTHLGLVRLQVADLERSVAYYQQIIGLAVLERRRSVALLGSRADGTPLVALHEHRDAMAAVEGGQLGLYHFAILLPDRAALGRFLAHLATTHTRAGSADHLVSEAVYLRDPDGLGIEVCADRPRDQWVRTAGEIRMGSLPLDVGTVVLAAGGERWTEIPAGTRIGHVHLHVGNLAEGSRFYHEALGFDRVVWSYRDALFLSAGGYHHHLGLNVWAGADAAR
jgi:catechol 2,3-dioxygenase